MSILFNSSLLVPFSPREIGGLFLWFDGADPNGTGILPSDGASVATWVDKSGNGNNATQGTGANQPVFKKNMFNGLPSMQSNSSTNMTPGTSGFPTGSGARTSFLVMQSSLATTGDQAPFQYGTGSAGSWHMGIYLGNIVCAISFAQSTGNTSLSNNTNYVLELNYAAGGTLSTLAGKVNGTTQTMTVSGTNFTLNTNINSPVIFQNISGYVSDILHFNLSLTTDQASRVRRYLGAKWGISVS